MPSKIELQGIRRVFGGPGNGGVLALDDISLAVPEGRFASIIGPSGCGKTTLFNILAGLDMPTGGRVLFDGVDVTGRTGFVGYMLQKDLLLPWRTILQNVVLGLELGGTPRREAEARALPLLHRYGLGGFEHRYPAELSGGMRQRAALLRTLLYDRNVVLLDEPFGALDAQTRLRMQEWLMQLWSDFGKTVLLVTHDVEEAVFLSDEIYVLTARPGRLLARIEVPLQRPRPRSVITSHPFVKLKERCLACLLDQEAAPLEAAAGS